MENESIVKIIVILIGIFIIYPLFMKWGLIKNYNKNDEYRNE